MSVEIFNYDNYRDFLADHYAAKKSSNPGYSYRVFSRRAGIGSPSHYKMVVEGKRNLSAKTIEQYVKALGLNRKESQYFYNLVMFNQATDLEVKSKYLNEVWHFKPKVKSTNLQQKYFKFLSKWYNVAIYVLVDTWDFEEDPGWIARRLKKKVKPSEVSRAMSLLKELDLIEKDSKGKWRQKTGALSVEDDTRAVAVFQYHQDMIKLAYESLKKDAVESREFNGATVAIPNDKLVIVKDKIRKFRREINELCSTFEHAEDVYQLNIQFFKITED